MSYIEHGLKHSKRTRSFPLIASGALVFTENRTLERAEVDPPLPEQYESFKSQGT